MPACVVFNWRRKKLSSLDRKSCMCTQKNIIICMKNLCIIFENLKKIHKNMCWGGVLYRDCMSSS